MTSPRLRLMCAALVSLVSVAGAETRRAVLVGINEYNSDAQTRSRLQRSIQVPSVSRPSIQGDSTYWRFENLDGALNDIRLMQGILQNLGVKDIVILTNQAATAAAILTAMQYNLVDDAQPAGFRLFYHSGHGNHMKNLASRETQRRRPDVGAGRQLAQCA